MTVSPKYMNRNRIYDDRITLIFSIYIVVSTLLPCLFLPSTYCSLVLPLILQEREFMILPSIETMLELVNIIPPHIVRFHKG